MALLREQWIGFAAPDLIDNYGDIPLDKNLSVPPEVLYGAVMVDPTAGYRPTLNASSTPTSLKGAVPAPVVDNVDGPVALDVYLVDLAGRYHVSDEYPFGYVQGRLQLGTYAVDGAGDSDPAPGAFTFDVSVLQLTAEELGRVVVTANYKTVAGPVVTSNFSDTLATTIVAPPALAAGAVSRDGASFQMSWTGGTPPFVVEGSPTLAAPWSAVTTTSSRSTTVPLSGDLRFFRVHENAPPR